MISPIYPFHQASLIQRAPDVWRLTYPRAYRDAGAWPSPKVPAVVMGLAAQYARSCPKGALTGSWLHHYLVAASCAAHMMPTYFVTRGLLSSVVRTDPPPGTHWARLPLPHPGLIYMLPTGTFLSPEGHNIDYLALARLDPVQSVQHPASGCPQIATREGNLIVTAASSAGSMPMWDVTLHPEQTPTLDDLASIEPGISRRINDDGTEHLDDEPISPEEMQFTRALLSLACRLWLVMLARPQLVAAGHKTGASKGPLGTEFWSPTIFGGSYRITTTVNLTSGPGSHASPRLHWRRGHMRAQRYGAGNASQRLIWIEPTLVGGKPTAS